MNCSYISAISSLLELLLLHIDTGLHVGLGLAWRTCSVQLLLPFKLLLEVELAILTGLLAVFLLNPGRLCVKDPVSIIPNIPIVNNIGYRDYPCIRPVSPFHTEGIIGFEFRLQFLLVGKHIPTLMSFGNAFSTFVNGGVK